MSVKILTLYIFATFYLAGCAGLSDTSNSGNRGVCILGCYFTEWDGGRTWTIDEVGPQNVGEVRQ